jgi:hypothetical protein
MRFCHLLRLTPSSRDGKQGLIPHKRIGAKSSVQCDQSHFIVFSPRTIFLSRIVRPPRYPKNLTEFPFAPNFSKPDLEGL